VKPFRVRSWTSAQNYTRPSRETTGAGRGNRKIQRQPLRARSLSQYRSQFLTVPRLLQVATQASTEHEFFPGSCWAVAGELPIAAISDSRPMTAEIRIMGNPPVRCRRSMVLEIIICAVWRSQGKGENPAKSMGLPVFPTGNRALNHKVYFEHWLTEFRL
jgi:hypothetical protein